MAVTAPAVSNIILLAQGRGTPFPGGARTVPAIVLATNGLVVSATAFMPDIGDTVVANIQHVSTAPAGSQSWSWPAWTGGSNS